MNYFVVTMHIEKRFSDGELQINEVMISKLDNELKMMKAVNQVASEFGVKILQPLLSEKFIKYAKTVPISEKFTIQKICTANTLFVN